MGHKAKHNRALLKRRARGQLIADAQRRWKNSPSIPYQFSRYKTGYYDGKLVHDVYYGKQSFPVTTSHDWGDYVVWVTACHRVLAVGSVMFTRTTRIITCLTCVTYQHRDGGL